MSVVSKSSKTLFLLAAFAVPASGLYAQQQDDPSGREVLTVVGQRLVDRAEMAEGPEIEGIISARNADKIQVTADDGTSTIIAIDDETRIKASGGFLGLGGSKLAADALLNGLPVSIETLQAGDGLLADRIDLKNKDLRTASMIRNGTEQRFVAHDVAIEKNAAATEALRGRMGDIDQYNIKGTTNVYFDTGKWQLSADAERALCDAATQAGGMDNALLLVVGYTDTVGDEDYNQVLSERRAGRVVNYLQQKCRWAPYRMLTPTGMAEADPLADNETAAGRAQNRRVSVNILVSKAIDGL
jgi:outer membrane protein OmpA-like peptidoglycan-associated protein